MASFPENVKSAVFLDFVFDMNASSESLSNTYKESIEKLLENESLSSTTNTKPNDEATKLTYETALRRLLNANRHVDELSGKILLERSLKYENDRLEFSRDVGVPKYFPIRYHLSEFLSFKNCIIKNVNTNILHLYAFPYPYGENVFNFLNDLLEKKMESSRKSLEVIRFEGSSSHHFHMIEPQRVANVVVKFLDEYCARIDSKL